METKHITTSQLNEKFNKALDKYSGEMDQHIISNMNTMLKTIKIKSYADIDEETYDIVCIGTRKPKYQYPLSDSLLTRFENDCNGFMSADKTSIFVCSEVNDKELLQVVAHELCHIKNKDMEYNTKKEIFDSEFNSHIQEFYLDKPKSRFTRSNKRKIVEHINEQYKTKNSENDVDVKLMRIL